MPGNKIFSLLENISPSETTFWTGSGISNQFPTNLPTGDILLELCIRSFMPQGTLNLINSFFSKGKFKDSYGNIKRSPRLELIIEDIVGVLGYETFEYFSFMEIPERFLNIYHNFFANHVKEGGTHFTTNFDNGIESAMQGAIDKVLNEPSQAPCLQSKLIKVHGTITENNLYESMGITLKNITKGFSKDFASKIFNVFENSKLLCFIGFGASDSFDVAPFFHSFIHTFGQNRLSNLNVIWIHHDTNSNFEICDADDIPHGASSILKGLSKAGSIIHPYKGNATLLVSKLNDRWGWTNIRDEIKSAYDWDKIFKQRIKINPIAEDFKNLIAGQYMAALGVGKAAVRFCVSSSDLSTGFTSIDAQRGIYTSLTNQWWRVYTNGLRDWGKYNRAIKNIKRWKKLATSPFDIFCALSRLMGEYRIKGNYFHSFLISRKAFKTITLYRLETLSNPDELHAIGDFLITFLHIHRDLWKKHKIIRKLLYRPWRNVVSKYWAEAFFINTKRPFPRYSAQLYELAEHIFGETDYFLKQARLKGSASFDDYLGFSTINDISNFLETDSLLGDINYQREFIIDKGKVGVSILNEIRSNLIKAIAIEDQPGIWKAYYRLSKEYVTQKNYKAAIENAHNAIVQMKKVEYSTIRMINYKIRLWKIILRSILSYNKSTI
jgi:hypothetical protein